MAKSKASKMPQNKAIASSTEISVEPHDRFSPQELKQVESLAGLGLTVTEIGSVLGISKATMERRLKNNPEIREAHTRGKALAKSTVARVAYTMATSGRNSDMTKFWLRTQAGFNETSNVRLTGADGGPVALDVAALTPEERIAQIKALDAKLKLIEED